MPDELIERKQHITLWRRYARGQAVALAPGGRRL